MSKSQIVKVSGPLVVAKDMPEARMYDVVKVGKEELIGEIVEIRGDHISIQVYEETGGLGPGDPVLTTGAPLSVELGPGMLEGIYDGIQRPLEAIYNKTGDLITRGIAVPSLDRQKKWTFVPKAQKGDRLEAGDILGVVQENPVIEHRIMVPYGVCGQLTELKSGEYTVADNIAIIKTDKGQDKKICMMQQWPVRQRRIYKQKLAPTVPLSTGQRIIDSLFPLAKGGTACIPGPFGSGKTVVQHQLAKWADADIVVYIGCGERGNEMTDVLIELPEIEDPRTGQSLMKRTVLIANTSNMPVAAREASIYTGITIAEYFRDMGYDVALMADSTSRWAEALREMSGRLEEMPGEEGYPAYLATKLADFYERAGLVVTLGQNQRKGSISAIGAVSPPGGDMSDPVVQATLKVVKVFWGLDDKLAFRRHFPAINWLTSYSLYVENLRDYFGKEIAEDWMKLRQQAMALLQKEAELEEIVRLIGKDSLSPHDQLTLEVAKLIREDFLHQNAFHKVDSYTSLNKQYHMLKFMLLVEERFRQALGQKISLNKLISLPVLEEFSRAKLIAEDDLSKFEQLEKKLLEQIEGIK